MRQNFYGALMLLLTLLLPTQTDADAQVYVDVSSSTIFGYEKGNLTRDELT